MFSQSTTHLNWIKRIKINTNLSYSRRISSKWITRKTSIRLSRESQYLLLFLLFRSLSWRTWSNQVWASISVSMRSLRDGREMLGYGCCALYFSPFLLSPPWSWSLLRFALILWSTPLQQLYNPHPAPPTLSPTRSPLWASTSVWLWDFLDTWFWSFFLT